MNNKTRDKLVELSQNSKYNGEKSEKLLERISDTFWEMEQLSYEKNGTLRGCLKLPMFFFNSLKYIVTEELEIRRRKKVLAELFGYSSDEMAGDNTEFTERTRAYVSDFKYDASVPLSNLLNLEVVWGDVSLKCLETKNIRYFQTPKTIIGDFHLQPDHLKFLENIEVVSGSVHTKVGEDAIYSKPPQKTLNKVAIHNK